MVPSAANVYARVREHLNDDEVAGGDLYTDAYLLPMLQEAVNMTFSALEAAESLLIEPTIYCLLPAQQRYLALSDAGITSLSRIITIQAKAVEASGEVTGLAWNVGTLKWRITSAAHGRATNDLIYLFGVADGADGFVVNDEWPIVVVDADNFDLLGAPNVPDGSYTAGSATWAYTPTTHWSFPFNPVQGSQDLTDSDSGYRDLYRLERGALRISPNDQQRLLKIRYRMKPDEIVSTAPDLRIDGSLDVLSRLTAGLAALSKGADETAAIQMNLAVGAPGLAEINLQNPGGLLGVLTQNHAQAVPTTVQTMRFRPRGRRVGF